MTQSNDFKWRGKKSAKLTTLPTNFALCYTQHCYNVQHGCKQNRSSPWKHLWGCKEDLLERDDPETSCSPVSRAPSADAGCGTVSKTGKFCLWCCFSTFSNVVGERLSRANKRSPLIMASAGVYLDKLLCGYLGWSHGDRGGAGQGTSHRGGPRLGRRWHSRAFLCRQSHWAVPGTSGCWPQ